MSVDGFVTTKFASVGGDVEIFAHTRGHIGSTQVTADILRYDMDPIDAINGELPLDGTIVSTVVLQNTESMKRSWYHDLERRIHNSSDFLRGSLWSIN